MLRTILLVVYLAAALAGAYKRGSGWDPLGLASAPPPAATDGRSGLDPLGLTSEPPPPPPETDARCGWDPLG